MIKTIKKYLSGSLKNRVGNKLPTLRLFIILFLANVAYADDITNTNNYLPNGKYRLFGSGRGEVHNIDNQIRLHGQLTQQAGNLQIETKNYQGNLSYQQHFHNHGHSVHSPFENKAQRNFSAKKGSIVQGGATLTDLSVTGYEIHPADAYDGEQGGGYPLPTGARDEYLYEVNGKEVSVKVVALDKLPNKINDNQLLQAAGIDPAKYEQPQTQDNRTQIERISFANNQNNINELSDLSQSTNSWENAQIRQPESLLHNPKFSAPMTSVAPIVYEIPSSSTRLTDEYGNRTSQYGAVIPTSQTGSKNGPMTSVVRKVYEIPNSSTRLTYEYDNRTPQYGAVIPTSQTGSKNGPMTSAVRKVYEIPNSSTRLTDEYGNRTPQYGAVIPTSQTGSKNGPMTSVVRKIIVTPSPYDRLNSGNSNYDKNTARRNSGGSQTNSRDNNQKSPTFDYNNYGYYNSDDNYYGYGGYDSYGDYGQGNNYSNLTENKSRFEDDILALRLLPPLTGYQGNDAGNTNNYLKNQTVEDDYDRLIKGFRNGTVGVAELLTTLGGLATDVIVSVRGRSGNSVDGTLKNALLGDLKSIDNLKEASLITHAQANALKKAAAGRVQSRINITNDGIKHISERHFNPTKNASQFSISQNELRSLLNDKRIVNSPVIQKNGHYVREIDIGKNIGKDIHANNSPTSILTVITDNQGNLLSAFPGVLK